MIFFRTTENINIKTTNGELVRYKRFKTQAELRDETIYISTFKDFEALKDVFVGLDKDKYRTRLLKERQIRAIDGFPIELGICNAYEYINYQNLKDKTKNYMAVNDNEIKKFSKDFQKADFFEQVKQIKKREISLVLIGGTGNSIGSMVASCSAIRIMYEKLKEIFTKVNIDIYLNASNNTFYSRDKSIFENQDFIREVKPLSLTLKEFLEYDCFIDNSSFFEYSLNDIDEWLYRFGIEPSSIENKEKYNQLSLNKYTLKDELVNKLKETKSKAKLLLFQPYSASLEKSIPQNIATKMLNDLIKYDDYIIVTTLEIPFKNKDERILDLSFFSKSFNDFAYIISNMDKIISVDTSTYHISDAFMIPTLVLSTQENIQEKIKYYTCVKAVQIKDKSKDLSKFVFKNDELILYKYSSWNKVKVRKLIKLLENL